MEATFTDKEFKTLLESIRMIHGYDFTDYAESSVKRRVLYFMERNDFESLDQLAKRILTNENVFEEFVQELSVTVTEMFRDPLFFKSLREKILKHLATYPMIKIWIAGCATGEEVYSIAILLHEEGLLERSIIYATDINEKSLKTAHSALYNLRTTRGYQSNYEKSGGRRELSDYYTVRKNAAVMDPALKENVVFSAHNLASDQSFNEFQLIICRNVLIYFNQTLQNKVIDLLYDSLCNFGFLGLGDRETLLFAAHKDHFEAVDKRQKIYRKIK